VLRHKIYIAGVFVGALGNALGAGAVALFIGQGFEVMTKSQDFGALGWIALWLIASQIIRGVLMLGRNFCSEVIGQRVERDTRDELYLNLLGKSMSFHDSQATGELMARATNDVHEINFMFNPGLNLVIGSANFMIAPFILVPSIHPQLLLVPSIYVVTYIFLLRGYLMRLRPATEAVRREFGHLNSTLAEAIDGIETVKGAAQEAKEISRFDRALDLWRNAFVWQGDVEARFFPLLLMGLLQAAGMLHSLILYQGGQLDVGQVVAFNAMLLLFQFPTFVSQFAYSQVSSGLSSARRVLELLNTETRLDQNIGGYDGPMDGSIQFDHVNFSFNGASPALTDVSFCIKPGQTVGP
jgi:ATP-binding cassette subfamily B protein